MSRGTLVLSLFLLISLMFMPIGASYGSADECDIHSMTVFFDSAGSADYEYMTWDFGDGTGADSRDGDEFLNPSHVYAEKGSYTVVQTVHNNFEGGTDVRKALRVNVLGPPAVTLKCGDETFMEFVQPNRSSVDYPPAEEPSATPDSDGREFAGWCTSEGDPYDWSEPVSEPLTLYASWVSCDSPEPREPSNASGLLVPVTTAAGLIALVTALILFVRKS